MMRISFGGRHYIVNQETLDEFVAEIVPRTREAAAQKDTGYDSLHRLRVNIPMNEKTQDYSQQLDSIRKELQGEIDLSFMIGRGPGVSFKDLLMQREGDVTVLYGAEDLDIRKIQPEIVWMADKMLSGDFPLGVGCRPQVMLHTTPEADLMRQLHEGFYALAAGASEELRPENPFSLDLSKGSSIFVGTDGKGGFGDITSGLSLFNHKSSKAQDVANYFSFVTSIVEPEMFTSEYAIHIHAGIENIFRAYTSYNENRFYEKGERPGWFNVCEDMAKIDNFIIGYNQELAKIPRVYSAVKDTVLSPETKYKLGRNLDGWKGFSGNISPEKILDRVNEAMRKGLLLDSKETFSVVNIDNVDFQHWELARVSSEEEGKRIMGKYTSFNGFSGSDCFKVCESYKPHLPR
ncbi:MAG TPA: hypothetical protein HA223_02110 [Nanoarchaeota archaeon]|nr:hypothetical protein [Nanoarchaeota archaeon]